MKFTKKVLLSLTISLVMTSLTFLGVNAKGVNTNTNSNNTAGVSQNDPITQDLRAEQHFSQLMSNKHKQNNHKAINIVTKYIKISNVSNNPNKPDFQSKVYDRQGFLQEVEKEKAQKTNSLLSPQDLTTNYKMSTMTTQDFGLNSGTNSTLYLSSVTYPVSISTSDSWLKLTLEFDDGGGTVRDIYGFYEWLTQPSIKGTDVFAVSHDANSVFDFSNTYEQNFVDYIDYDSNEQTATTFYDPSTADNYVPDTGGIGYKFPLNFDDGLPILSYVSFPYGVISVVSNRAGSTITESSIVLYYEHQIYDISLTPSVGIPLSGGISLDLVSDYNQLKLGNVLYY